MARTILEDEIIVLLCQIPLDDADRERRLADGLVDVACQAGLAETVISAGGRIRAFVAGGRGA